MTRLRRWRPGYAAACSLWSCCLLGAKALRLAAKLLSARDCVRRFHSADKAQHKSCDYLRRSTRAPPPAYDALAVVSVARERRSPNGHARHVYPWPRRTRLTNVLHVATIHTSHTRVAVEVSPSSWRSNSSNNKCTAPPPSTVVQSA